jgi:hypothetical protein
MATPATTMQPEVAQRTSYATSARKEIGAAWSACQKPNLQFGKVCCKWRDTLGSTSAGPQTKGTGLAQILSQLNIKEGVAYYWMDKYEISICKKVAKSPSKESSEPQATIPVQQGPTRRKFRDAEPIAKMEPIASGGFWEILHGRLNPLVPSFSDGVEHKTIEMLQRALTEPADNRAERNFRKYVIELLDKISRNFASYAQQLKNAEVVQGEHPTTSGEMVYQTNPSAPILEAIQ